MGRAKPSRQRRPGPRATPPGRKAPPEPRALLYKVVELSTVDERALEETVNAWVRQGWAFDGVQFAMRDSSKRPAMAFVFFTREGLTAQESQQPPEPQPLVPQPTAPPPSRSAYDRLRELAGEGLE